MDTGTSMYNMGPPLLDTSLHPMAMVFMGMLDTILYELSNSRINTAPSANHTEPHAAEIHMLHQEHLEKKKDGRSPIIIRTNNKTKTPIYIDLVKGKIHNAPDEDSEPSKTDILDNNNSTFKDDALLKKTSSNEMVTSHEDISRIEKDVYFGHNSANIDINAISKSEKDIDENHDKFTDEEVALKNNDSDAPANYVQDMLNINSVPSSTVHSLHEEKVDELKTNTPFSNEQLIGDANLSNKISIENNHLFKDEREVGSKTQDDLSEKTLEKEQSIDGQVKVSDNEVSSNEPSILRSGLTEESSHVPIQDDSSSENKVEHKDKPHKIRFHRKNKHAFSDSSSESSSSSSDHPRRNRRKNLRKKSRRRNFYDDFASNKYQTTRMDDPFTQNMPDDMFYFSPFDIPFSPFDMFNNIFTPPPFCLTDSMIIPDNNKNIGPDSTHENHAYKEIVNDNNQADTTNDIYGSRFEQKLTSPDVLHGNPTENVHINAIGSTSVASDSHDNNQADTTNDIYGSRFDQKLTSPDVLHDNPTENVHINAIGSTSVASNSLEDTVKNEVLEYPKSDVFMPKPISPTTPSPSMQFGSEATSLEESMYIGPKTLLRLDGAIPTSPPPTENKHLDEEHDMNIEVNPKMENVEELNDGWLLCDECNSGCSWSECWIFPFNGPYPLVTEEEDLAKLKGNLMDDRAPQKEGTYHNENQENHDKNISINTSSTAGEQSDPEASDTNITSTKNDGSTHETAEPNINLTEKLHTIEKQLGTHLNNMETNETHLDSLEASYREDSKNNMNESKTSDNTSRAISFADILTNLTTSPAIKTETMEQTQRNETDFVHIENGEIKETNDKNAPESKPTEEDKGIEQETKVKYNQENAEDITAGNRTDFESENDTSTVSEIMHIHTFDLPENKTTSMNEGRHSEEKNDAEVTMDREILS